MPLGLINVSLNAFHRPLRPNLAQGNESEMFVEQTSAKPAKPSHSLAAKPPFRKFGPAEAPCASTLQVPLQA